MDFLAAPFAFPTRTLKSLISTLDRSISVCNRTYFLNYRDIGLYAILQQWSIWAPMVYVSICIDYLHGDLRIGNENHDVKWTSMLCATNLLRTAYLFSPPCLTLPLVLRSYPSCWGTLKPCSFCVQASPCKLKAIFMKPLKNRTRFGTWRNYSRFTSTYHLERCCEHMKSIRLEFLVMILKILVKIINLHWDTFLIMETSSCGWWCLPYKGLNLNLIEVMWIHFCEARKDGGRGWRSKKALRSSLFVFLRLGRFL